MAKYMERRYVQRGGRDEPHRLWDAIHTRDLLALLQAFAEGHDLAKPLATPEGQVSPPGAPPREGIAQPAGCGGSPGSAVVSHPAGRTRASWRCTWPCATPTGRPCRWWTSSSKTGTSSWGRATCGDVPEVLGCPHEDGERRSHALELSLPCAGGRWTG